MAQVAVRNIADHKKGDTFNGLQFQYVRNVSDYDIDGASIVFDFKGQELSTENGGVTITDASLGKFRINEQIINWPIKRYNYEMIITWPSGRRKTYLQGLWNIIE